MTIWIQRVISPSLVWSPANLTTLRQKSFPKLSFLSGWFQEVLVCGRQELGVCFLYSHIGSGGNGLFSNLRQNSEQTDTHNDKQTNCSIFLKDSRTFCRRGVFPQPSYERTECLFKSVVSFDGNYNRVWPWLILGDSGPGLSLSFPWIVGIESGALVPQTWDLIL